MSTGVQRFQPPTSIFRSEGDSFQIRHVQRCDSRQEARFIPPPRQASTLAGALRAKVGSVSRAPSQSEKASPLVEEIDVSVV